ncbi:Similar to Sugar transport protein 9; acc. no. Q9SX48 [Pyronema omphalodes CBS 100304]|uniref:Similar to Sugar transport protein 9 acc. no. Q9SX48 n=1 Tax=Pyronema omphalodes (strain CBS 100304) TaxID=1076935 RepID=U4LV88_PYROM|nr:Similar to Sugar transport protein 9; acc. no. Q9SX48 [Pyronema omphalodes CBS 100304]
MDKVEEAKGPGDVLQPSKPPSHAEIGGTTKLAQDPEALAQSYGRTGFAGLFDSGFVVRCAIFAAMGGFLFGYDQGVISVTLVMDHFNDKFPKVDENQDSAAGFWKGFMTAMLQLGAMFGAAQAGYLADKFSRKYAMFIGFIWFLIGSTLQTAAVNYPMLVVGRAIGGVGIGVLSMVAPLYISEIAPPNARGALLVLEEWSIVFGIIVAFYITYGTRFISSHWSWRLPFLLQMVPAVILIACMKPLPFSPRWLSSQGRHEEALQTFERLRRLPASDDRVMAEWLEVRAEAIVQKEIQAERHPHLMDGSTGSSIRLEIAGWADCFRKGSYKRTMCGIMLMFFQQFVGINGLIYYSPSLFQTLGLDFEMRLHMSGVMNILQIVGVTPAIFLMDRVGRRPLLIWGSIAMCICHVIVAAMVGVYGNNWNGHENAAWVGVAFIFIYMVVFGLSWGPVPWAMPTEIFNSTMRAKGVALSTCSNWFNNFIIGLITPALVQKSPYGAFAFFAVFSFLSGVWSYFVVPETAGRTLEDMDAIWGDDQGRLDKERTALVVSRLEMELAERN